LGGYFEYVVVFGLVVFLVLYGVVEVLVVFGDVGVYGLDVVVWEVVDLYVLLGWWDYEFFDLCECVGVG